MIRLAPICIALGEQTLLCRQVLTQHPYAHGDAICTWGAPWGIAHEYTRGNYTAFLAYVGSQDEALLLGYALYEAGVRLMEPKDLRFGHDLSLTTEIEELGKQLFPETAARSDSVQ